MRQWLVGLACIFCSSAPVLAEHRTAIGPADQESSSGDIALYHPLALVPDCLDIRTAGTGRPPHPGIESKEPRIDIWVPEPHPHNPRPAPTGCMAG
ncbi:hypothetical protein [Devosia sediminis]|uniref:Uncharacterized protein n=1 Tax=Devosia sediminis TaxID=2798801 RepID=A0A934IQB0_9HYPH|nr:hypothetical protein [Devosia sediminis]MBJ3784853.1 hypothetical protein [Devosia sediminis]